MKVEPEIMIPLVGSVKELDDQAAIVAAVAEPRSSRSAAARSEYLVGTMIEIPRAALTADEIAARRPSSSPSAPTT